jgi:hypothetical protein
VSWWLGSEEHGLCWLLAVREIRGSIDLGMLELVVMMEFLIDCRNCDSSCDLLL